MSQSDNPFRIIVRPAQDHERRWIEAQTASGEGIASDACVPVWVDAKLIGWGDDYGTFHLLPAPSSDGKVEGFGEELLEAAVRFWEVCQ